MRVTQYRRTECPYCGGTKHKVTSSKKNGCVRVRHHKCACGKPFVTREVAGKTKAEQM